FNLGPMGPCPEPPYARQLGLLAQTLGRPDDAVGHLAEAEAACVRAPQASHLGRVRYELAGALLARGGAADRGRAAELPGAARAIATELGQPALLEAIAERAAGSPRPRPTRPTLALRRDGDSWSVTWGAATTRLRDSRGLQVLAKLVESPGRELHVLELVGGDAPGDPGTVSDARAVQGLRRRLVELREEHEEAERFADRGRAERASAEMDFLTAELAGAVGLGGRLRPVGDAAERARTAVQKRI